MAPVLFTIDGCGGDPEPMYRVRVSDSRSYSVGSPAEFVAIVPVSEAPGRCESHPDAPLPVGTSSATMAFGEPVVQRVTITLDVEGEPINYSDIRGDLISSDDYDGDQTRIFLNLRLGHAFATNRPEDDDEQTLRMTLDEAYEAESLGNPRGILERVLEECSEAT